MTKITTILTSTLLASTAIAFSANASNNDNMWGDLKVEVHKKTTVGVYATDDLREFDLLNNRSKDPKSKNPAKNVAPKIDFGKRVVKDEKYNDPKFTIDTSKPNRVQYSVVSTLSQDRMLSELARTLDVVSKSKQIGIYEATEAALSKSKADLEWMVASIASLNAAHKSVYQNDSVIYGRKTDKDYWTALKEAHDKNEAARPAVLETEKVGTVYPAEADQAEDIAIDAISSLTATKTLSPAKAVVLQEVTKKKLLREMMKDYAPANFSVSSDDAETFTARKANIFKLQKEVRVLSDSVGKLLDTVEQTDMWTRYQAVIKGTATYNVPAPVVEMVAAPASLVGADVSSASTTDAVKDAVVEDVKN